VLLIISYVFNKIGEEETETCSAWKWGRREGMAQIMYKHVSKVKKKKKELL
jgi:phosphoribosyl-ATP pyrophosphohydrolase